MQTDCQTAPPWPGPAWPGPACASAVYTGAAFKPNHTLSSAVTCGRESKTHTVGTHTAQQSMWTGPAVARLQASGAAGKTEPELRFLFLHGKRAVICMQNSEEASADGELSAVVRGQEAGRQRLAGLSRLSRTVTHTHTRRRAHTHQAEPVHLPLFQRRQSRGRRSQGRRHCCRPGSGAPAAPSPCYLRRNTSVRRLHRRLRRHPAPPETQRNGLKVQRFNLKSGPSS